MNSKFCGLEEVDRFIGS